MPMGAVSILCRARVMQICRCANERERRQAMVSERKKGWEEKARRRGAARGGKEGLNSVSCYSEECIVSPLIGSEENTASRQTVNKVFPYRELTAPD